MTLPDPTIVFRSHLLTEASSVASYLEGIGLTAKLITNDLGGPFGASPVSGASYEVLVSGCSEAAVDAALDSYQLIGERVRRGASFCYHCGEELPESASACPSCGKPMETDSVAPSGG